LCLWNGAGTILHAAGVFVLSGIALLVPGCTTGRCEHEAPAKTQRSPGVPRKTATAAMQADEVSATDSGPAPPPHAPDPEPGLTQRRQHMVQYQLRARDITDPRVLAAMARVPRHEFVPAAARAVAYSDGPLPIGHGQTISQPYIVALMTQLVQPKPDARALDVGTGSGYQAAILAGLVGQVYSIEIIPELANAAGKRLKRLGFDKVEVRCGDGYRGWPEHAPFNVIIVAAAPDHIPQPLIDQLAPGGRLVIPVGRLFQKLIVVEKRPDGQIERQTVAPVSFVPMTGEAQRN
jgi:protein-L-isoaspartate(D-aspartate) O-methyltransferase